MAQHGGNFVVFTLLLSFFAILQFAGFSNSNPTSTNFDERESHSPKALRASQRDQYLLGVGKADITGPVVEINFMGYASPSQVGTGLRQRIFARAFIIGDINNTNDRFIYLNIDTACGDTAIRYGILEGIAALGPSYSMYTQQNVAVVGTHQHSGPGAWLNYLLPQVTSLGFDKQSYDAIVNGSILAIQRAHESLVPGYLDVATANVTDANINRSLYAYLANPEDERVIYADNVEKFMTMMRFQRTSDGKTMGILTWFPVHGTSALENNTHVTGDNKGVAEYLFEKAMLSDPSAAENFVAGFSQASVGDTTPNVLGAWCDDGSGQMCSFENSTCSGAATTCHGRGPLFYKLDLGISSCYEIGRRQYQPALDLYVREFVLCLARPTPRVNCQGLPTSFSVLAPEWGPLRLAANPDSFDSVATPISESSVKAFHFFQNMEYFHFELPNGTAVQTCPAALGYSFAAGTTDGPGPFDFTQADSGKSNANPLWAVASDLLKTPSSQQTACQYPKPILLDVGEMSEPYAWSPNIVDVQMFRVGQFFIIVSPSEVTTMSGRRWKSAVASAAVAQGITSQKPIVVVGSPANTYAHYVTTPEEYTTQRYEGASTLYGQWELPAYINLTVSNIKYLASDSTTGPAQGTYPPDNRKVGLDFISPVVQDNPPIGKSFGEVLEQPSSTNSIGDVINATFVGADPRNNLRLEGTFTAVEQLQGDKWVAVRDDWDWNLSLTWTREDWILGTSNVVLSWESETYAEPGTYRFHYYGDAKGIFGAISSFEGISTNFTLK